MAILDYCILAILIIHVFHLFMIKIIHNGSINLIPIPCSIEKKKRSLDRHAWIAECT